MPRRAETRVEVHYEVVERLPGVWCPTCALPSAFRVTLAIIVGLSIALGSRCFCPDCRGHFDGAEADVT